MASDIIGQAKEFLPPLGKGSGFTSFLLVILIIIVLLGVAGYLIYVIYVRKKFKYKIVKWERINGKFIDTGKDKAAEIRFKNTGDTVFYLKRHKKWIPRPNIQTGINRYFFFVREDGEWINFELEDLDEKSRQLGAKPIHQGIRLQKTAMQKHLKDRYDKEHPMLKYVPLIISIVFLIVAAIFVYLLFDKQAEISNTLNAALQTQKEVLESARQIITGLQGISTGSGLVPA